MVGVAASEVVLFANIDLRHYDFGSRPVFGFTELSHIFQGNY
jgi:hypothetical protein